MNIRLFSILAALCLGVTAAFADSAAAIQGRMAQRLSALDGLKAQQAIGENNRGFVEVRGNGAPGADALASAENQDREQVYGLIAGQTGASADAVGRARAKKIAENSRPGVWLQDESGKWYRK